jgi:hypothetical protein
MKIPDITYRTPVVRYDPLAQVQIFERRNTATGEVTFQTPSPEAVKALESGATASSEPSPADLAAKRVSLVV